MQRMTLLEHYRQLADVIGPRSGASDEERKTADYVADQLTSIGLTPLKQSFYAPTSAYGPFMLYAGIGLLSLVLLWQTQPVGAAAAAIIMATGLLSIVPELQLRPNLLRWLLPIDKSANVIVELPHAHVADDVASPSPVRVIVLAPFDGQRKPAILGLRMQAQLIMAAVIAGAVLVLLAIISVPAPADILRQIALAPGLVMLALLVIMVFSHRAPYEKGTGDNAGSLAVGLGMAEKLRAAPLAHADVTIAFTGASEAGCYGAMAYFASQPDLPHQSTMIVLDGVGAKGTAPAVVRAERYLKTITSDAALLAIADKVMQQHPEWGGVMLDEVEGRSALSVNPGLAHPAIRIASTLKAPAADETAATDPDLAALEQVEALVWGMLQTVDASSAQPGAPDAVITPVNA